MENEIWTLKVKDNIGSDGKLGCMELLSYNIDIYINLVS
jgi:hypothetical protein